MKASEDVLNEARRSIDSDPAVRLAGERLERARAAVAEAEADIARFEADATARRQKAGAAAIETLLKGEAFEAAQAAAQEYAHAARRLDLGQRAEKVALGELAHARAVAGVREALDSKMQAVFTDLGRRITLALVALAELGGERSRLFSEAEGAGVGLGRLPQVANPEAYIGNPLTGDGRVRGFVEDALRARQIAARDLPRAWAWAHDLAARISREAPPEAA